MIHPNSDRTINAKTYNIVKNIFHVLLIIGILLGLRIAIVLSFSAYFNHEGNTKQNYTIPMVGYTLIFGTGDFMETYKSLYNAGTSAAHKQDYDTAQVFLEMSLNKVDNIYNECFIRANLAYVYEKQGDYFTLSEQNETAKTFYDKAISTVQEAPAECFPPQGGSGNSSNPDQSQPDTSDAGESMENTENSSQEKKDQSDESDTSKGSDQVKKDIEDSKSQSENQQDQDQQEQNKDESPQVDKPW
jgi:hypothetical protein